MANRTIWQQTMNTQVAKSLALLETAHDSQTILDKSFFIPALESFKISQSAVLLTEEEEALAQPTIIRIERQKQINAYIIACKQSYGAMNGTQSYPAWLLLDSTTEIDYQEFFAEITNTQTELLRRNEYDTGLTLEQLNALYSEWLEAKENEKLDEMIKQKIHAAIDLRDAALVLVKMYGYGDKEIGEFMSA